MHTGVGDSIAPSASTPGGSGHDAAACRDFASAFTLGLRGLAERDEKLSVLELNFN